MDKNEFKIGTHIKPTTLMIASKPIPELLHIQDFKKAKWLKNELKHKIVLSLEHNMKINNFLLLVITTCSSSLIKNQSELGTHTVKKNAKCLTNSNQIQTLNTSSVFWELSSSGAFVLRCKISCTICSMSCCTINCFVENGS